MPFGLYVIDFKAIQLYNFYRNRMFEISDNGGTVMTVLVTGGAGFIGANFIFYQLKHYPEDRIVCADSLTYAGNTETLKAVMNYPNFCFYKADITDKEAVDEIFCAEKPDIVVHFAAETHVDRSIHNYDLFLKTNVMGTQVLLEACIKYDVQRFHHISTDEVYGDVAVENTDLYFTESSPLHPSSPYAATKAAADMIVLSYYKTYGFPVTVTRSTNNYGPFQFPEKLIPLAICRAVQNRPVPLYGNGRNIRSWLYVEDHCRAVDLVMRNGKAGEIYNVGTHSDKSNIEIANIILKELNKSETLLTFVADRPAHDRKYAVDFSKIEKELGWKAQTAFDNGIRKTIEWYSENQTWCKSVMTDECKKCFKTLYGEYNFF